MSLGGLFSNEERLESIRRQFVPGQVLYIHCDFTTPPKPKRVVLICVNPRPLVLLINSRITRLYQADPELLNTQILLRQTDNEFLDHDSYLDCSIAFEINQEDVEIELLADMTKLKTQLSREILDEIMDKVADSPRMPPRHQGWIINDLSSSRP